MIPFDPEAFVKAQAWDYQQALAEIRAGRKRSHWIWYIFPQLAALGHSSTAQYYGLPDLAAARAYFAHPLLQERLLTITRALLALETNDPAQVMGGIDALKLRSCMTLFEAAAPGVPEFPAVLDKYYGGQRDPLTLSLLEKEKG